MRVRVVLLLAVVLAGGTAGVGDQSLALGPIAPPEPVDFVRFNGNVYEPFPLATSRLTEADLGPQVGAVTNQDVDPLVQWEWEQLPCYWEMPDGTAQLLPLGTPIFAVRGYATGFRLAIRQDEGIVLYEAVCSDWARVGADLLDIYGRVTRIDVTRTEVRDGVDQPKEVATIRDPGVVDEVVDLLLAAPIGPNPSYGQVAPPVHYWYGVTFVLDDGTTTWVSFQRHARTGVGLQRGGISVPPEFGAILDRALQQQQSGKLR